MKSCGQDHACELKEGRDKAWKETEELEAKLLRAEEEVVARYKESEEY